MTVMLLQRSVTPQSTHSQKTTNKDCSAKPPLLFLLDDRQDYRHSVETDITTTTIATTNHNNNTTTNNNNNNNTTVSNNNNNNNNYYYNYNDNLLKRGDREESSNRSHAAEEAATSVTSQRRADCGQDVAMRYYRLWIYTCNLVLLGSALGFAAAVSRTLLFTSDPRRYVVPGVPRAFDPTALYAYLALATQLGLVQLLGCIAARRLSARLLNAYWVLLLALLFGDVVIGVAWVFRFERMIAELRPNLRHRLQVGLLSLCPFYFLLPSCLCYFLSLRCRGLSIFRRPHRRHVSIAPRDLASVALPVKPIAGSNLPSALWE